MMLPRLIPVLLLEGRRLVKTLEFADPKYIGDPINAVKIFNEKEVDELILLDITATLENREPDCGFIAEIAGEAFMPIAYGGGIRTLQQIKGILRAGAEKVSLNTAAFENPNLVREAALMFGSQSIIGAMDIKKNEKGTAFHVYLEKGEKNTGREALEYAQTLVRLGVGELFINSIDRDGTMAGYDCNMVQSVARSISIPVIACGGAGELEDFKKVIDAGASAAAAGSYFVFCGSRDAILITYPDRDEWESIFK